MEQLPRGAEGLDFGSGPGPTLSEMLGEAGFCVKVYDPFFAPDAQALNDTYDFITCTETAEHFFHPAHEFDRLHRMLRPGGWLALMTEHYEDQPFEQWWYARDPTHACFYRARTMTWLADHYRWRMVTPHRNVRMFQRGTTDSTEVSRDTWVP